MLKWKERVDHQRYWLPRLPLRTNLEKCEVSISICDYGFCDGDELLIESMPRRSNDKKDWLASLSSSLLLLSLSSSLSYVSSSNLQQVVNADLNDSKPLLLLCICIVFVLDEIEFSREKWFNQWVNKELYHVRRSRKKLGLLLSRKCRATL